MWTVSGLSGTPLISSNYFQSGFGVGSQDTNAWVGAGTGPFDTFGMIVKFNLKLASPLYLNTVFRFGKSEGISENTLGFGLTFNLQ